LLTEPSRQKQANVQGFRLNKARWWTGFSSAVFHYPRDISMRHNGYERRKRFLQSKEKLFLKDFRESPVLLQNSRN